MRKNTIYDTLQAKKQHLMDIRCLLWIMREQSIKNW